MLKEQIKNSERIWKAIETLVKAAENEKNHDRLVNLSKVIQQLSDVHKSCVADFQFAKQENSTNVSKLER